MSELKRLSLTREFEDLKDSLIRHRIVGVVSSDELRGELLKSADLTLQNTHDYCKTFEAAKLQKFKFHVPMNAGTEPSSGIKFMSKSNGQDRTTAWRCKFCGYKHLFTRPNKCPAFEKSARSVGKKDTLHRCAKRIQEVDMVKQDNSFDEGWGYAHIFWICWTGNLFLTTERETRASLLSRIIAGGDVRIKADTGSEATVLPYNLYTQITKKPLQKIHQPLEGWLAWKPIHPKGSVSLRLSIRTENSMWSILLW